MLWLLNTFLYKNFTILRTFEIGDVTIHEYVYNSKTYYSDVWPPDTSCRDFPISTVVREDGKNITEQVLKFSGPRRNYVNPISISDFYKRITINLKKFGRIRFEIKEFFKKYCGEVTVTNIFGSKKVIKFYCDEEEV